MTFSSVDLPEPHGPMIETYSPSSIASETSSSALTCWSPTWKCRLTLRSSIMGARPARSLRDGRDAVRETFAIDGHDHALPGLEPLRDLGVLPVAQAGLDLAGCATRPSSST